jgi:hypothetical protein
MTDSGPSPLIHAVWQYPLFEALYGRRSRRFGLGFEITEGPFRHKSQGRPPTMDPVLRSIGWRTAQSSKRSLIAAARSS